MKQQVKDSAISSVGIIGFGSFGKLVASLVPTNVKVLVHDPNARHVPAKFTKANLTETCKTDVVILAIPLSAYPKVLKSMRSKLNKSALLIDTCSVKLKPEQLVASHLPNHGNILMTHPLFGPQSAAKNTAGHQLIVTKSQGARAEQMQKFCQQKLGLALHRMSSADHDKSMASVHALTFFVARSLSNMNLQTSPFQTPSYKMLSDLVALDHNHSDELFETIELGNPFAKQIRADFISELDKLDSSLSRKE